MPDPHFLEPFFNPQSVAIIGLSRSAIDAPVSILTTLRNFGYPGKVVVVNPGLPVRDDLRVFPDIASIDIDIDLAVVTVPRATVPDVLVQCSECNILNAIVISQGFADADETGQKLQEKILQIKEKSGMRILGPNTIGVSNGFSSFTSSFFEMAKEIEPVGLVAQSGLFFMGYNNITDVGAGYGMALDLGNGCDISITDVLDYYDRSEGIEVIQCHIESIENGRQFIEVANRVARKKPVIALKAGNSELGKKAVASHSGAAAGEAQIYTAAFEAAGVIEVDDAEEMRLLSRAFTTFEGIQGRRVAVLTFSGGAGVLAIDAIEDAGLELAVLSEKTLDKIKTWFPSWMKVGNPLDVWIAVSGDNFHEVYPALLDLVLQDTNVDAVLCIYASFTTPKYDALNVSSHLKKMADRHPKKPLLGWSYGLDVSGITKEVEQDRNVIVFPSLKRATECLRKLNEYQEFRGIVSKPGLEAELDVDRERVNHILQRALNDKRTHLFLEVFEILNAYGIDTAPSLVIKNRTDIENKVLPFKFPLAMKLISSHILHKSDTGGVLLGIGNTDELLAGFDKMVSVAKEIQVEFEGVFLQEMIPGGQELLLGAKNDPVFGAVLIAGAGGIYTNLLDDFSFAIAPVDKDTASAMIRKLKFSPVLNGARGQQPCDMSAITEMLVRVSRLAWDFPEIRELDLNPVIAKADGATVIDARILL